MKYHGSSRSRRLIGFAVAAALGAVQIGCAHGGNTERETAGVDRVQKLESRVEELEKTNGRLSVRLDEMEDEVFLLQDRVEAHRLALKRRGFMQNRTGDKARASAPQPTPQTNYGSRRNRRGKYRIRGRSGHSPRSQRESSDHPVTRIPLSRQQAQGRSRDRSGTDRREDSVERRGETNSEDSSGSEDAIVITEEDFQKFARGVEGGGSESKGSSGGGGSNRAKEPVTDEKLPTGDESKPGSASSKSADASASSGDPYSNESGLDLYKSALAKYRSGEYATALDGFERFLSSKPRKDYRDNGLYWVGECHFGLGHYRRAIDQFERVLNEEPSGNKVPDAMLKMALAYREVGMKERARKILKKLTRRYPSTNAGRLGEKKLAELKS